MSDRIHVLSNGRPSAKKSGDYITVGEAQRMVDTALAAERVENEKMVKWYCTQLPELVAKMLGDALAVNGLTMQPPAPPAEGGATESDGLKRCASCGEAFFHLSDCGSGATGRIDFTTEPAA